MNDSTRVKVATAVTALFLGGIATAGLLSRASGEDELIAGAREPQVAEGPGGPATVQGTSYVSAPAVASPLGTHPSSTADEDDDEHEDEEGESE